VCRAPPPACKVSPNSALPKRKLYAYDASRDKCRKTFVAAASGKCALASQRMFQTKFQCETQCMAGRRLPQLPYGYRD